MSRRGGAMRKLLAVLLIGLIGISPLAAPAVAAPAPEKTAAAPLAGLDEFVAGALKDWTGPGVAGAVVKDGQVILSKGYGTRDLDQQLPVTPKTLFAIGSITKSFTVTALGMLVGRRNH